MRWDVFVEDAARWRADPGLPRQLTGLLPDTTDDTPGT